MLNKKQALSMSILHHWKNWTNAYLAIENKMELTFSNKVVYEKVKKIVDIDGESCACCKIYATTYCCGCPINEIYVECGKEFGWIEARQAIEDHNITNYLKAEEKMIYNMEQILDEGV